VSAISDKLIVALDVENIAEAERFVKLLRPEVKYFKIGIQLFTAAGQEAVAMVAKLGGKVFLDAKFYDIPNTVYLATDSGATLNAALISFLSAEENTDSLAPVFMMTVHARGGKEMMQQAARAAQEKSIKLNIKKPYVVGVTVLTSDPPEEQTLKVVLDRARLAKESGLDGVVCSAQETKAVKKELGDDFIVVNPGIRAKDAPGDDQKRTATAQEAIAAGADFIVVGRPILKADDPLAAVRALL
jgi:orotidine-5'-phosphate decarboxylase